MRMSLVIACLLAAGVSAVTAAEWSDASGSCFSAGAKTVSIGASFGEWGVNGAFDYGFHDAISGGGAIGYNAYIYSDEWVHHNVPVLVRAAFHPFNLAVLADKIKVRDRLDAYIGFSIGWKFGGWTGPDYAGSIEPDYFGLIAREYIGARWHFSPNMYVFVEDCAGLGWINAGIGFKL